MTNDTNTLNGALQELGETMADNLTTMGVPSTYDEGLTTLAQKILSIGPTPPTPTPASITLTADKSILSYADTESAVLTATVLDSSSNPVEGVSVDLYKDNVLWDTLTTGSAGTVSKTYTSAGVGDVGFTAECGSLVTESFVIHDNIWNWNGSASVFDSGYVENGWLRRSSDGSCNLNTPIDLPSHFIMTYTFKKTSTTFSEYVICGESSANSRNYHIGNLAGSRFIMRRNTDNALLFDGTNVISPNTEYNVSIEYDNGSWTCKLNNNTYTASDSTISMDYLFGIGMVAHGYIKDMQIKPL